MRDPFITQPESRDLIHEVSQSVTRSAVLLLVTPFLLFVIMLGTARPAVYLSQVILISLPVLLVCWLVFRLVENHLLVSQIVIQAGLFLTVTLALLLFRQAEIVFAYMLLPILAAVTTGWPFALLAQAGVMLAMTLIALNPWGFGLNTLPARYPIIVISGGAIFGALGAIITTSLIGVIQRAYKETRTARQTMEETRHQRMELIQTQADLLQANRELARLSDRLKALTQVAEDARRVKEEFVANVSHELRTPLNMIIGFSELIAKAPHVYGELPSALLADIAAIQRNSQHLSELVNDVLDLSQIEAGRMALIKDWTTLQELVEAAVSATQVLFDMKGLYLKTELPPEPVRLLCDRTRVREVLLNLLSNAGRFTDQGGVCVHSYVEGDNLIVAVKDTGPGIAPQDQSRLFEPFQQLDTSIRKVGGTGLGLSISKRFVEMHGGKMWLESQVGQGTSFFFSLPMHSAGQEMDGAPVPGARRWITPYHQFEVESRRSKAPMPEVGPRFVLLDGGSGLQRLFGRYLEDAEIINTQSVDDAMAELSRSPSQALIINGASTGLAQEHLQQYGTVPFATPVMTCWVAGDDETARRLGVNSYLLKPVSRDRLLNTLHQLSNQLGREIRTILIVDDQLEILQLFARILNSSNQGYVVLRARNGKQALELIRARRPDVVLLDLVMPEMDGFAVINEKNRDETIRDIPVVVVSSKDPTGAPIVSDQLSVTRKGGLSARELLTCIQSLSEILAPETPLAGQALRVSAPE